MNKSIVFCLQVAHSHILC